MFKYSMSSSVFPAEASFPLLLAELLPSDLERVLFLDADTMVMDDIGRLWDLPLGKKPCACGCSGCGCASLFLTERGQGMACFGYS